MSQQGKTRRKRTYGTGGLRQIGGSWYGTWRDADGRKVQRKIGAVRTTGKADGITKLDAEKRLTRMREETAAFITADDRVTMEAAGAELCARLALRGRKKSHRMTTASDLRNHIVPFFGSKTLDRITSTDIERYVVAKEKTLAIKTVRNHVNTIHSVFELGVRQGWCPANPVKGADRPVIKKNKTRIRFLDLEELEKLIATSYPDDAWGSIEPALYLTAAMTGLRQGEALALRWRDVDFQARRIRVVQNYVRGEFNTPKSEDSSRSIPMATRVAEALLDLHERTDFSGPDQLVFCHPSTGNPLDRSKLVRRFKQALERAEIHQITFHELRHTFGTTMAAANYPRRSIQAWMGHEDGDTTEVYMHYAPRNDEVEAIDRAFS